LYLISAACIGDPSTKPSLGNEKPGSQPEADDLSRSEANEAADEEMTSVTPEIDGFTT